MMSFKFFLSIFYSTLFVNVSHEYKLMLSASIQNMVAYIYTNEVLVFPSQLMDDLFFM